MMEWVALLLFVAVILVLLAGFPVAFTLGGTALVFAGLGVVTGTFNEALLSGLPNRIYGIMNNETLVAVPLFVFMGVTLERARIAEELLETLSGLFGSLRGGLGISVTLVGMLLAASTGIVGATVVTMGLLSLPTMLRRGYSPEISAGTICASGTLGQIIPPSIILVMLGDVMTSAYQQAQLEMGIFSPKTVSVGDLFAGALIPGLLLVLLYVLYIIGVALFRPATMPAHQRGPGENVSLLQVLHALLPPLFLVFAVLGSILTGLATPTEAAGVGAMGALLLAALRRQLNISRLREVMQSTLKISSMVFLILIGASVFSLVFRGYGGDDGVRAVLEALPGGVIGAVIVVMLVMAAGYGPRSCLAGHHDRDQSTDFVPDTAIWIRAILLARCRATRSNNATDLPRRYSFCWYSAVCTALVGRVPRSCHLAAQQDLRQLERSHTMQNMFRSVLIFLLLAFALAPITSAQDDAAVFSVAYIEISPSMTEQAMELLKEHARNSRAQDGNLRFQLLQRTGRPNHFAILDAWESRQHQDEHTAASKAFQLELGKMLYSPYDERKSFPTMGTSATGSDGEVYVLTHVDFAPPSLEKGLGVVESLIAASRQEAGASEVGLIVQESRKNHMTLFEVWSSVAAHETHTMSDHTMRARGDLQALIGALYDERLYRRL
jgi:tripartite ATP-independent transporter DctM subunit